MTFKTGISILCKFIFAFALITWMVTHGMLEFSSLAVLKNPPYLAAAIGLVFLHIFINNLRWTLLLRIRGYLYSNRQTLPLALIGTFFNFALPSGVGGDVVKGYYVLRESPGRKTVAATTLLMDRLLGLYGMALVAVAVILAGDAIRQNSPGLQFLSMAVIALFLVMTATFAVAFSAVVKNHRATRFIFDRLSQDSIVRRLYDSIHSYRHNPLTLLQGLLLSLASQFIVIFFFWFFARITDAPIVPFTIYLYVVPLGLISTILPVTPAGIGVGQAAMYYLYRSCTGLDSQIGPNALTAFQIIELLWGLLGAYFYVTRKRFSPEGQRAK